MKGKALAAGAAVGAVVAIGVGAREVSSSAPCQKPLTLLQSEQDASIAVLEKHIAVEVAPDLKNARNVQWGSDDYSPTLQPGRISARIFLVAADGVAHYYNVSLSRDCAGGEWKVEEFSSVKADRA